MPDTSLSPLAAKQIVVTRAASQTADLLEKLSSRGAIPVLLPLISFAPPDDYAAMDAALSELHQFDWVFFTSANSVRAVEARCETLGCSLNQTSKFPRVAAVGPRTAAELKRIGISVDFVPRNHNGVSLAEELPEQLEGKSVLLPRSDRANPDLPAVLRRQGATLKEIVAYRTLRESAVDQEKLRRILSDETHAILFFSPSAVHHFADLAGRERLAALENTVAVTAVGHVTAGALRKSGVHNVLVAAHTTADAVIAALEKHFAGTQAHNQSSRGAKRG